MPFQKDIKTIPLGETQLFQPIQLGNITLPHRVVMAPITRMRGIPDGFLPDENITPLYYGQRAQYPGTLIITEATFPSFKSTGYDNGPGCWSDEQNKVWKQVFEAVHKEKSYVFVQIYSLGRQAELEPLIRDGLPYVSASDEVYTDNETKEKAKELGIKQHGLTGEEIKEYIQDWINAAKKVIAAGADGIEVHAANGYLLNQFLDIASNKRNDKYGGSIENRARFVLEMVDAMVDAVGADKVGIRVSPFGKLDNMAGSDDPDIYKLYSYLFDQLESRAQNGKRLAYIHIIEPRVIGTWRDDYGQLDSNGNSQFIYEHWKGTVIRAGAFGHNSDLVKQSINERTLIAYGRFFISNPDLVRRLKNGLPLNKYDRSTFYTPGAEGYITYPTYEVANKLGSQ